MAWEFHAWNLIARHIESWRRLRSDEYFDPLWMLLPTWFKMYTLTATSGFHTPVVATPFPSKLHPEQLGTGESLDFMQQPVSACISECLNDLWFKQAGREVRLPSLPVLAPWQWVHYCICALGLWNMQLNMGLFTFKCVCVGGRHTSTTVSRWKLSDFWQKTAKMSLAKRLASA